ncbi:MAG: flagellar protein FlaG [Gammaproteobacteria bacterium]|uniref:flagellar protein FlaG n=1 Tax=Pseudomaricurvus alcaniphilus TaxID=1166482 RepID=UPI00140DC934|nr:flagellar protein FlaG [Pseudomaricurvus alcaniphilus]MBR9911609.1 flagellar protein FlaG [Gammaproteobacteria bacterium]NHN39446.1 flagellar protein FlaG [Pseudomaricurvus alcaniphilus]
MNEVSGQLTSPIPARSASSKGTVDVAARPAPTGNSLPEAEGRDQAKMQMVEVTKEKLQDAVTQMNQSVQMEQRDLRFSIDEASGHTVVRVLDRHSGDVIRQIPNEVFLDMARTVGDDEPLHLINVHG